MRFSKYEWIYICEYQPIKSQRHIYHVLWTEWNLCVHMSYGKKQNTRHLPIFFSFTHFSLHLIPHRTALSATCIAWANRFYAIFHFTNFRKHTMKLVTFALSDAYSIRFLAKTKNAFTIWIVQTNLQSVYVSKMCSRSKTRALNTEIIITQFLSTVHAGALGNMLYIISFPFSAAIHFWMALGYFFVLAKNAHFMWKCQWYA